MYVYVLALHRLKCRRRTKLDFNVLLQVRTPTDVSDDAARLQVQQELADLGPGFVAAVVEVRRDLVVDAVHVLPLELTGSLLHGVRASCSGLTVASFCRENTTLSARTELINAIAAAFHQASATKSKVDPPTGAAQRCFAARICSEFSLKPLEGKKKSRQTRKYAKLSAFVLAVSLPCSPTKKEDFIQKLSFSKKCFSAAKCIPAICNILYCMFPKHHAFHLLMHIEAENSRFVKYKCSYHY